MKIGKTSFAANTGKALILSFEPGVNALSEIYSQKILTWTDMKIVVKQLANEKVKEKYDFIAIDTVDIA